MTSRSLFWLAALGAAATALVVAASALLRIATQFDGAGTARSLLPPAMETAVRMLHRGGASIAGLAALAVAIVVAIEARVKGRLGLAAAILLLTTFLALVGRYSAQAPGAAIPVANVVAGTLLACAFAALCVQCYRSWPVVERPAGTAVLMATFLLVLGVTVSGVVAASDGATFLKPWHVGLGLAILGVVAYCAQHGYEITRSRLARRLRRIVFTLAVVQLVLGMIVAALGAPHAITVAWMHAMAAAALALGLALLASRNLRPRALG